MYMGAAAWVFREIMSSPVLAYFKAGLTQSSSDGNRLEGIITTYAGVANYLLMKYATSVVIFKADEDPRKFKQDFPMPWDLFQWLPVLTLRWAAV